jgi:hypothetical protein
MDFLFSRRERHAKTLEVAQEEVLTCIGLCLYDRLHRIQQRLKEEERTAKVLAAAATQALGRNFQVEHRFSTFPSLANHKLFSISWLSMKNEENHN